MHSEIVEKLCQIEADYGVRILWAIESGSRSWGFDSPDSDFDVRFIYVHQPDWYMTIEEERDVIELPVDEVFDISGWDLRKTLRLLSKSNPVLIEWLVSPFVYLQRGPFRDRVLETVSDCFSQKACSYHYLRMAENNWNRYILPRDPVNAKKYFYVLRPLLNILWLSHKNSIPPMQFEQTLRAVGLPIPVLAAVEELLEKKKTMAEIGKGPRIGLLDDFIQERLAWSKTYCESAPVGNIHIDALNSLFRQTVRESWAG